MPLPCNVSWSQGSVATPAEHLTATMNPATQHASENQHLSEARKAAEASSRPVRHPLVVKSPTQSQQQEQPVSGEQPHPECSNSSHDSPRSVPKQQTFAPLQAQHSELDQALQAQHSELGQAQQTSQAENGSSIAASKRQMPDNPQPNSAAANDHESPSAAQGCAATVNSNSHDAMSDTVNQVCCCFRIHCNFALVVKAACNLFMSGKRDQH